MKHFRKALCVLLFLGALSCSNNKLNEPAVFDIVGQWGVTAVTYTYSDLAPSVFDEMPGQYYNYWTFQINGIMIDKPASGGDTRYATYVYDENKKKLTYLYDGYHRPVEAWVTIHSPGSITITADLKEVGSTIYKMKKIAW